MGKIKEYWNQNKDGALYGAVVGGIGWYIYAHYYNVNPLRESMIQSIGIIDKVLSYMPKENLVTLKVMLLFVLGGAIVGMIVDSLTDYF